MEGEVPPSGDLMFGMVFIFMVLMLVPVLLQRILL